MDINPAQLKEGAKAEFLGIELSKDVDGLLMWEMSKSFKEKTRSLIQTFDSSKHLSRRQVARAVGKCVWARYASGKSLAEIADVIQVSRTNSAGARDRNSWNQNPGINVEEKNTLIQNLHQILQLPPSRASPQADSVWCKIASDSSKHTGAYVFHDSAGTIIHHRIIRWSNEFTDKGTIFLKELLAARILKTSPPYALTYSWPLTIQLQPTRSAEVYLALQRQTRCLRGFMRVIHAFNVKAITIRSIDNDPFTRGRCEDLKRNQATMRCIAMSETVGERPK